jgi:hypothetical protein
MDLLFKREQSQSRFVKVQFKLWGKIELDEEEKALIDRYRFHDAILIASLQPTLIRQTAIIGVLGFFLAFGFLSTFMGSGSAVFLGMIAGIGAGYWWFNEKRDTIFVKDLIHGRYFSCNSVVELARKEAWLETVVAYLRQVMESAKQWDGTEKHKIEPLPKDEARAVILRGI